MGAVYEDIFLDIYRLVYFLVFADFFTFVSNRFYCFATRRMETSCSLLQSNLGEDILPFNWNANKSDLRSQT